MKIICNKEEERFLLKVLEESGVCVMGNVKNCHQYKEMGCTSGDFERCFRQKFKVEIINKEIEDRKLQCAACGFSGMVKEFFDSSVHSKFKICPCCGTIRFVCDKNIGFKR